MKDYLQRQDSPHFRWRSQSQSVAGFFLLFAYVSPVYRKLVPQRIHALIRAVLLRIIPPGFFQYLPRSTALLLNLFLLPLKCLFFQLLQSFSLTFKIGFCLLVSSIGFILEPTLQSHVGVSCDFDEWFPVEFHARFGFLAARNCS